MSNTSGDIRTGFVRQRRSLIVTSLVLFFYQTSGIVVESINVFGTQLYITNSQYITAVIWLAWIYFFLRYYQYFRDTQNKGFRNAFNDKMSELAKIVACKLYERDFKPELHRIKLIPPLRFEFVNIESIKKNIDSWVFRINVNISSKSANEKGLLRLEGQGKQVSNKALRIPKLRSIIYVALNTRLGTEYILPFLIAAVPICTQIIIWTS